MPPFRAGQETAAIGLQLHLPALGSATYGRVRPAYWHPGTYHEPYAIATIAGIKLCESYNRQYGESHGVDYRSVMPTNLYGPGDN